MNFTGIMGKDDGTLRLVEDEPAMDLSDKQSEYFWGRSVLRNWTEWEFSLVSLEYRDILNIGIGRNCLTNEM